ncbi:MAG TPA: 4-hydroxy-tetrahydrodipicolinate reductase [Thermoanaerobaculia bacterium]|nr:4-hydroxy-tetrahydrodipicolinate reductase [Thermoanaerobaculia bacterium]
MLRVTLAGATGWIGKPLVTAIEAADELQLVAAAARSAAGQKLGEITIMGTIEEALQTPSDVFVDYTSATAVKRNVLLAIDAGRHVVVGSSGLSDLDYAEIDTAAQAKSVGVIAVGNFAVSAILLQQFAAIAAKHMPSWEIIDYAHDSKPDAPSGTARELAWRLSQVAPPKTRITVADTQGRPDARGAEISGSQIHSVRLPGHTIALEVIFGREDERLTMRYEGGTGAAPYIEGTLLAIRRAPSIKGLQRGME